MPPEAIDDGVAERLARTLRRYCNHRIHYNRRESQAQWVLAWIGLWFPLDQFLFTPWPTAAKAACCTSWPALRSR